MISTLGLGYTYTLMHLSGHASRHHIAVRQQTAVFPLALFLGGDTDQFHNSLASALRLCWRSISKKSKVQCTQGVLNLILSLSANRPAQIPFPFQAIEPEPGAYLKKEECSLPAGLCMTMCVVCALCNISDERVYKTCVIIIRVCATVLTLGCWLIWSAPSCVFSLSLARVLRHCALPVFCAPSLSLILRAPWHTHTNWWHWRICTGGALACSTLWNRMRTKEGWHNT